MRIVYVEGKLYEDVLVAKIGFLKATKLALAILQADSDMISNLSVVNFCSLYAVMKAGDNLKARRLKLP